MNRKNVTRTITAIAVVVLLGWSFFYFSDDTRGYKPVDTSVAITQINGDNVKSAQIDDREQQLRLILKKGNNETDGSEKVITKYPTGYAVDLFNALSAKNAKVSTVVNQGSILGELLVYVLPLLLLVGLFVMFSRMQGGARMGFGFGKSRAKQLSKDMPKTTFADVAGVDEAVEELYEIKDFLQNPSRYQALGAKIPKGVLLYGPPGTGKTLLARAVAGEAGVPFFTISGSDFVEMFVGVGASRVRDLFEQAKQNSPCIIFVDEIDAVGRQRGAGLGGGHDEREQTLNQLLVEMDGFGDRAGVILIAATNRPDILDPALLRPGRFDRQIPVSNPDLAGRRAVLRVHSKGKPMAADADLDGLAKRTVGMTGADLANVINEAALLTARENGTVITGPALEEAVDRVIGGPRRKGRIISEQEKKITAYHEGGHTLAAWAMPDIEPIYKVTILARGRTGGHAVAVPEEDKGLRTRSEMIAQLVFAMGGRAAEELVFREPTTGAVSDIEQATKIARSMVTEFGMSSKLGAVKYGSEHGDPFLGRTMGTQPDYSHEVAREIDEEVRKLIEAAHTEAWEILTEYRDVLDTLAGELLEKETLHRPELESIFADVEKRPRLTMFDDFGGRIPSDKPPIKTPGELAIERGEPWPQPVPEPAFKVAIAQATQAAEAARSDAGQTGHGANGSPAGTHRSGDRQYGSTQPDYGAPAGWHAPGWPPRSSHRPSYSGEPAPTYPGQPYPTGQADPGSDESSAEQDDEVSRTKPAHG
ncbi:ATP-dependent zinc metalloprotease FtsH [Mycobacterium tuberculosis UT0030]|uniref:ATP-dependent zinc metalloprotease FtsH n=1 Tax=Mycobacterium tuberculosis TaxID=1773 RepID=UPI00045B232C|nr:ATP-dependent zinc metalloprotease FtsH [Mycobacterium tuberculosis]KBK21934.1 ATP-dependent zinc metalloprotease FtsH [Mycobacterium tuberculosis UT0030]KBL54704.1 ATP-dependent zinc metalloprotease FtsH [Mycobacterium tuberculosis UT0090]KBT33450.1 ATP-dependent zinc metalloprotease FtsH [Mycobacterium tuberculosis UT0103]KCH74139.1 ATP-dependent zinc metalloprotease FtsH [Mycobacterium tuberculosis UT0009]